MASTRDFFQVNLTENDVPGAKLDPNNFDTCSNIQLKRWLECRGIKTSGNRSELLDRWMTSAATPTFWHWPFGFGVGWKKWPSGHHPKPPPLKVGILHTIFYYESTPLDFFDPPVRLDSRVVYYSLLQLSPKTHLFVYICVKKTGTFTLIFV